MRLLMQPFVLTFHIAIILISTTTSIFPLKSIVSSFEQKVETFCYASKDYLSEWSISSWPICLCSKCAACFICFAHFVGSPKNWLHPTILYYKDDSGPQFLSGRALFWMVIDILLYTVFSAVKEIKSSCYWYGYL